MSTNKAEKRYHFWLVSSEVSYNVDNSVKYNNLIKNNVKNLSLKDLEIANLATSSRFKRQHPDVKMDDINILNMMYLGHMTDTEFKAGSHTEQATKDAQAADAEMSGKLLS